MSVFRGHRDHLGDLAAALVDDQLDLAARDRALAHLARCPPCRTEVEEQRRVKSWLRGMTDPAASADLTARLLATGTAAVAARRSPRRGLRPGGRSDSSRPRSGPHRRNGVVLATAASVVVAGLAVAAFAAGGQAPSGPAVTPAVDRYAVEHAATTNSVPLPDAGVGAAVTVSYVGTGHP